MLGLVPPPSFRTRRDLRPRFAQLAQPRFAMIRRIADLENTIAAVLALIEERQGG